MTNAPGGLYRWFQDVGSSLFAFLIGRERASHPRLEVTKVRAGGCLVVTLISAVVLAGILALTLPAALATSSGQSLPVLASALLVILLASGGGLLVGAFLGALVLSNVLIAYLRRIERADTEGARRATLEVERAEAQTRREREQAAIRRKRYEELVAQGTDQAEAEAEADQYTAVELRRRTTERQRAQQGCFVATLVFGSAECHEVMVLRHWRDNKLARSTLGRIFVAVYYVASPRSLWLFRRNVILREVARLALTRLVLRIESRHRCERLTTASSRGADARG